MDNNFFNLIKTRESCRDFDAREIEREKIIRCVEAGSLSPSARNLQPWHFTVVTEPEIRAGIAKLTQINNRNLFTDKAAAFIVISELSIKLDIPTPPNLKPRNYAPIDVGITTAHICLAATAQGLSSCIIGTFDDYKLADLLDISDEMNIRLVIALGYAASPDIREKKRRKLEETADFIW